MYTLADSSFTITVNRWCQVSIIPARTIGPPVAMFRSETGTRHALTEWCKTSRMWKCQAPPLNRPKRYQTGISMKRMSTIELKEHLTVKKKSRVSQGLSNCWEIEPRPFVPKPPFYPYAIGRTAVPFSSCSSQYKECLKWTSRWCRCLQEMACMYPQGNGTSSSALREHTQPSMHSVAHCKQANKHSFYCSG